ncbi:hypothetical protein T11_5642 [Trichinella zimbabwensis]|uniref:Uncharacterized protein n=1 Tax=Trichinella zimbabwensis TaxID=268475 RepID=A0A0V1HUZ5_9BILA|nr:hypothetical protein T11_5642 [Trichinella zimbabwensis]
MQNATRIVMVSYAVHRHCSACAIHHDDFLTSAKKQNIKLHDEKTLIEDRNMFIELNTVLKQQKVRSSHKLLFKFLMKVKNQSFKKLICPKSAVFHRWLITDTIKPPPPPAGQFHGSTFVSFLITNMRFTFTHLRPSENLRVKIDVTA